MNTDQLFFLVPLGSILALVFAFIQARRVLGFSEGSDIMKNI